MQAKTDLKQIIMTAGAKGGTGKTTFAIALADFFRAGNVPVTLVDADLENKGRGSLSHAFKDAPKVDIRTPHGLDEFVNLVLMDTNQTILADLGAGSSKDTFGWFDAMHEALKDAGIRVLTIGMITNDSASTATVLNWANALQDRTDYLLVCNKVASDDFSYLFESEPGKKFLKLAHPAIVHLEARLPDLQQELNDRGLSPRQALAASPDVAGPVLSKAANRMRLQGYVNRMEKELSRVIDVLIPAHEASATK